MAANLNDAEEREYRIEKIGDFFYKTGLPTRQIADYFTAHYFPISNKTVHQYIQIYMKEHPNLKEEINKKIINNTEVPFYDEKAKTRILKEAELVITGYTYREISELLNISIKTVEHDISERLSKLALLDSSINEIYNETIKCAKKHQVDALNQNRNINRK